MVMYLEIFPALESCVGIPEPETASSFPYVLIYLIFNPDMALRKVAILKMNSRSHLSPNYACHTCLGSLH